MEFRDRHDAVDVRINEDQLKRLSSSRIPLIIGLFSTIVALIALFVSYLQLDIYKQQLQETRRQINDAREQNNRINESSKNIEEKSTDQDRRQSRAYVEAINFAIPNTFPPNGFKITFSTRNVGKTKARELYIDTDWEVVPRNKESSYRIKPNWTSPSTPEYDSFPDLTVNFHSDIYLSEDDKKHLSSNDYVFIFYGKIYYKDVYDSNHEALFCHYLEQQYVDQLLSKKIFDAGNFIACTNFNSGN